jgi:hypothetical protein
MPSTNTDSFWADPEASPDDLTITTEPPVPLPGRIYLDLSPEAAAMLYCVAGLVSGPADHLLRRVLATIWQSDKFRQAYTDTARKMGMAYGGPGYAGGGQDMLNRIVRGVFFVRDDAPDPLQPHREGGTQ